MSWVRVGGNGGGKVNVFSFVGMVSSRWRVRIPRNEAVYYGVESGLFEISLHQFGTLRSIDFIGCVTKDYRFTIPRIHRRYVDPKRPLRITLYREVEGR